MDPPSSSTFRPTKSHRSSTIMTPPSSSSLLPSKRNNNNSSSSSSLFPSSIQGILLLLIVILASFYLGIVVGSSFCGNSATCVTQQQTAEDEKNALSFLELKQGLQELKDQQLQQRNDLHRLESVSNSKQEQSPPRITQQCPKQKPCPKCQSCPECTNNTNEQCKPCPANNNSSNKRPPHSRDERLRRFPKSIATIVKGAALVNRTEFMQSFDTGIPDPLGGPDPHARQVLVLYQNAKSLPTNFSDINNQDDNLPPRELKRFNMHQYTAQEFFTITTTPPPKKKKNDDEEDIVSVPLSSLGFPKLSTDVATQNCDVLYTISTKPMLPNVRQCLALVGQVQADFFARYMRVPDAVDGFDPRRPDKVPKCPLDASLPLRRVGRGLLGSGVDEYETPRRTVLELQIRHLQLYLQELPNVQWELQTLLTRMEKNYNKNNNNNNEDNNGFKSKKHLPPLGTEPWTSPAFGQTLNKSVVVMVSNLGQSDLLMNFVCNARSKQLDLSRVIVFCTDQETYYIALQLGLYAFRAPQLFANIPKHEAPLYGDATFRDIMIAKSLSVQLVNSLGYDVLFQDVDIIWNENPLDYFQTNYVNWDILFQDDGARSKRFAPYEGNSGFYFVRHNSRTVRALLSMIYQSDLTLTAMSHQQALMSILSDHASLYGLTIKTMPGKDFPCGHHFHRDLKFMKNMIAIQQQQQQQDDNSDTLSKQLPRIFHMSWTLNKANKLKFMQQVGFWHIDSDKEMCSNLAEVVTEAVQKEETTGEEHDMMLSQCCSVKPVITCHFRDKPSLHPCPDSPKLDKGLPDFWETTGQ